METQSLKVELGGGPKPRDGYLNVDICERADIRWDLNDTPWPLADDSVQDLYSSHCLEHVKDSNAALHEIARVCKVGAHIEIRVPHPGSGMALCTGHHHILSPQQMENSCIHFPDEFFPDKKLVLLRTEYGPTTWLADAKREMPFLRKLPDHIIMKYIPNTCHESIFTLSVAR